MNKCEHGQEIFIKETGDKVYSGCKLCRQEYENNRAMERLMEKHPNSYVYCSNIECNAIFAISRGECRLCGSEPERMECSL